ncbi:MAG: Endoribonuclease YbeY [Verrucomicrobiota bacterium]|jgi:probable rRNA maturation factor
MEIRFTLNCRSTAYRIERRNLLHSCQAAFAATRLGSRTPGARFLEIPIVLMGDKAMAEFNWKHLRHEGPTDVITFDYLADWQEGLDEEDEPFVPGEIYISLDTASREAAERQRSLSDELLLYIVHGLLHLRGYDDHDPRDRRLMRAAERRSLASLRLKHGETPLLCEKLS